MVSNPEILLIFFLPFIIIFALVPVWIYAAKRYDIVDSPGLEKIHNKLIPTAGGIIIFFVFFLILWMTSFFYGDNFPITLEHLIGLTLAGAFIFFLGIYDDLNGCPPYIKLFFQAIAASILWYFGFSIKEITNPFGDSFSIALLSFPITVFWIVLIINAINLIDGLDGLASGIIFISSSTSFIIAWRFGEPAIVILSLILAGTSLGFLLYNFPPAKVFLGDTGSMFLGLIMAGITLLGNREGTIAVTLLVPIVFLGIPLIDTVLTFFRRSLNKQNPFKRDLLHLHHRLLRFGLSQRRVVIFFYLLCIYLGLTALLLSIMPKQYVFLVALVLATGILIGMETLRFLEHTFKSFQKLETMENKDDKKSGTITEEK